MRHFNSTSCLEIFWRTLWIMCGCVLSMHCPTFQCVSLCSWLMICVQIGNNTAKKLWIRVFSFWNRN
jgi:hypothetical protein